MKKRLLMLLLVLLLTSLCACGGGSDSPVTSAGNTVLEGELYDAVLNTMEYTMYQNVFYNSDTSFDDKTVTKTGTFAILDDRYNDVTRYYVWGYNDATKCCDWQWEFVPAEGQELPASGSMVEVTGTFVADDASLDGYWIEDAEVKVLETFDVQPAPDTGDTRFMSATLAYVQLANIHVDGYEGKEVIVYGRVASASSIQHPYYDNFWEQDVEAQEDLPAIGTIVVVDGTYEDGTIVDAVVTESTQY